MWHYDSSPVKCKSNAVNPSIPELEELLLEDELEELDEDDELLELEEELEEDEDEDELLMVHGGVKSGAWG
jgi:hypothetical protein